MNRRDLLTLAIGAVPALAVAWEAARAAGAAQPPPVYLVEFPVVDPAGNRFVILLCSSRELGGQHRGHARRRAGRVVGPMVVPA